MRQARARTGGRAGAAQWWARAVLLGGVFAAAASAGAEAPNDEVPRHPLERRALTEPEAVLAALPAELAAAGARGDHREQALLQLARANACRIAADWPCQRDAGAAAVADAEASHADDAPLLVVRGLIAQSRGAIALQEFALGERLLTDAGVRLRSHPQAELEADVDLAWSSLNFLLGRHAGAAEYADRGLAALGARAPSLRVRLLRNKARAQAQLGQWEEARRTLALTQPLQATLADPKLSADIELELARVARARGDVAAIRRSGEAVQRYAEQLDNAQLHGQADETLGLAAAMAGDADAAQRLLRDAAEAYHGLHLQREELNALQELLRQLLRASTPADALRAHLGHYLDLQAEVAKVEAERSAEDLSARIRYAEQAVEVERLRGDQALSAEREAKLTDRQQSTALLALLSAAAMLALAASFYLQRRLNRELALAMARLRESEARYRVLADHSRDLVVRMRPDGTRLYVSPSVCELLGWEVEEAMQTRWELVHPDDRARLQATLAGLLRNGDCITVRYRLQRKDGSYAWMEALAQLAPSPTAADALEIIYTARDVSERVLAEQALERSEARLRAVTDNTPALIAHIDDAERYTFANALSGKVFGVDPAAMVGRSVREVRGEAAYRLVQPHIAAVLRGERQQFEGQTEIGGRLFYFETILVPDRDDGGIVRGFYSLTSDITPRKLAELELARLAHADSLTGLANRRHFDEGLAIAVARAQRHARPLALLYLDIDRFKAINDSLGHQVGDAVIREFAQRLQRCLRQEDLVARLGGDEFVVLLEDIADAQAVAATARKIVEVMRNPFVLGAHTLAVSTSIGAAFAPTPRDPATLTALADRALYAAKARGRDTWTVVQDGEHGIAPPAA